MSSRKPRLNMFLPYQDDHLDTIPYTTVSNSNTYTHRLYGEILEPEHHIDLIDNLYSSGENDVIYIYLNSSGGSLNGAISIIHAINNSKATIICISDGEVASAATLIFFAIKNRIVLKYSYFLLHDGSGSAGIKMNEVLKDAVATSSLLSKMANDLYYPFFSKQEIKKILEGVDYHLDATEMVTRLDKHKTK